MTPASLVHSLWTTRRGVGILILSTTVAIAALLYGILVSAHDEGEVVSYGSVIYRPDKSAYCPGEIMTFPVQIVVSADSLPTIRRVVEAWRRDSDGVVLESTGRVFELPLVSPMELSTTARRVVPNVAAGVYWLNHVSKNGSVDGYTVGPVTIKDCQ